MLTGQVLSDGCRSALLGALGLLVGCSQAQVLDNPFERSETGTEDDGDGDGDTQGDAGDSGGQDGDGSDGEDWPPREPIPIPSPGDGSADGGDGADAGEPDGGACLEFSDALAPVPPTVLFLLDRSGSMMASGFDPDQPDKSRWAALYGAVEGVVGQQGLADAVEFGAKTFSTKGFGACGVSGWLDVPFALDNAELLLDIIPGPNEEVTGGTPTQAGVAVALDQLRGYEAEGSKVLVLVTDGSIGCADDSAAALADITGDLASAREVDGIATFVVGIAPEYNSTKAQLTAMAGAGGTNDYLGADDAAELADALAEVVAASFEGSCLLELDAAPNWPELTVVETGGVSWPEVQSCDAGDGWMWTNDELTRMRLCNAACDTLLETHEVLVEYHCDAG